MHVRHFLASVLFMAVLISFPLQADQNHQRLPGLFDLLAESDNPSDSQRYQNEIWLLWLQSGRPDIDALMTEGVQAMNTRAFDTALAIFDEIVEKMPDFAEGWNKRATVYYLRNEYGESMRDIQRTLALEPRHFGALSGMGLIFIETGDTQAAIKAFTEVLQIDPQSLSAKYHIELLKKQQQENAV